MLKKGYVAMLIPLEMLDDRDKADALARFVAKSLLPYLQAD